MLISDIWFDSSESYERLFEPIRGLDQQDRDKSGSSRQQDDITLFMLAAKLRKIRLRLHMSQEEFAEAYRLPLEQLKLWELAQELPSDAQIKHILKIERDPEDAKGIVWG